MTETSCSLKLIHDREADDLAVRAALHDLRATALRHLHAMPADSKWTKAFRSVVKHTSEELGDAVPLEVVR